MDNLLLLVFAKYDVVCLFEGGDERGASPLIESSCHAAEANVTQVLQPFEVGDADTARIAVEVRDDDRALPIQRGLRSGGDGAIRT